MPMLIQHIDQIARKKKRDVLIITFAGSKPNSDPFPDYDISEPRKRVLAWLSANRIHHYACAGYANLSYMESYRGQIYVDVPFDLNDPDYQKLTGFLEHPDGTMKITGVEFSYLPLRKAMENVHHDEPGFWEKQAAAW